MEYAGFWKRVAAYLIDSIPIYAVVLAVFYFVLGLGEAFNDMADHPDDEQASIRFHTMRGMMRLTSAATWLVLCSIMESTWLQGSFGKVLFHIKVVDQDGRRLTFKIALLRNAGKILSVAVLGLGYLWATFSERRQCWHDLIAQTLVVKGEPGDSRAAEPARTP